MRKPAVYLPLVAVFATGWAAAFAAGAWDLRLNGPRFGVVIGGNEVSAVIAIRGGWPSKEWIEREHVRAPGTPFDYPDGRVRLETLGFDVVGGSRVWYGNDPIRVRGVGVSLPWWYLLLLAAAAPLETLGRRMWAQRPSERRRRAGLCVACGYDLRASGERCPECGAATQPASTAGRETLHGR